MTDLSRSHSVHKTNMYQVFRGLEVQLSDAHTRAVAQDNKVACCPSAARYEPDNPPKTPSMKSFNLLACAREAAQLYLAVQRGVKDRCHRRFSTNTAMRRKGRVIRNTGLPSLSLCPSTLRVIILILKICSDVQRVTDKMTPPQFQSCLKSFAH